MKVFPHNILKKDDGDTATIYLYGYIGQEEWWGDGETDITDVEFLRALNDFEKQGKSRVDVRINSYGGSMLHMDGIVSLMQSSKMEIHTWVDGVAASAAATIFLAAKKTNRHMAKNSKLMLHSPAGGAYGSAQVLRDAADMLDAYEEGAIVQLASDTGKTEEEVKASYFDGNDHWFSAKECMSEGFVDALENYEVEKMPKSPENMSRADFEKYFQNGQKEEAVSIFKKLFHAAFPNNSHTGVQAAAQPISQQNKEEMNIENLKASLESGEIQEADVVALLQERGTETEKPAAATVPQNLAEMFTNMTSQLDTILATVEGIETAQSSQLDRIEQLEDRTPGAGPTVAKAEGDPPSGEGGEDDDELKAQATAHAEAAKNWKNPFIG